jgi:hypothetical protein
MDRREAHAAAVDELRACPPSLSRPNPLGERATSERPDLDLRGSCTV